MKKTKENNLSLDELICNDSFQRWVYENKKLDKKYWETFVLENPETFDLIEEAKICLLALRKREKPAPAKSKQDVWQGIENYQSQKARMRFVWSAAASFLILILCSSGWLVYRNHASDRLFAGIGNGDDLSNATDIKLILSDIEEHKIGGEQSNITFQEEGKEVLINEKLLKIDSQSEKQMNQIIVPYGKRTSLTLADGTVVHLNAGSKLVFPPHFTKNKREVYLTGEAYFEVFHNKECPFYVITNEHKIKVLGTKFNVKAYGSAPITTTVLIEGQVVLQTENLLGIVTDEVYMTPNQRAVFHKDDGRFSVRNEPNAIFYASWKDGWMYFSKQSLTPVLAQIERYYNVKFDLENIQTFRGRISGKLDLKDSLEDVLNVISRLAKVSFKEEEGKIKIYSRT